MKNLAMVCGALIALFGLSIMLTPLRTYFLIGWVAGFVLIFNGISTLLGKGRRYSKSGIVTLLIGIVLLITDLQQVLSQVIIVYLVAGGVMVSGIIECIFAYIMIKSNQKAGKTMFLGIVSFSLGLSGLLFKDIALVIIGVIVGYHIFRVGLNIFGYAKNFDKPVILD